MGPTWSRLARLAGRFLGGFSHVRPDWIRLRATSRFLTNGCRAVYALGGVKCHDLCGAEVTETPVGPKGLIREGCPPAQG